MPRPTVAEIDLPAIAHNLRALRSLTSPGVECIGIVKADAYGHGAVPVSRALAAEGVRRFAVATVDEGIELHDADLPGTILILGAPCAQEVPELVAHGFEAVISDLAGARLLDEEARKRGRRVDVHLKFDTGMGRIGFFPEKAVECAAAVASLPGLRIIGGMTHFPSAGDPAQIEFTREQVATLARIREKATSAGLNIPLWHAANSPGTVHYPEGHFDAIRPGISLYGGAASLRLPAPDGLELRQAMTFKTLVAQVRDVPEGKTISYGRTYRTERPSRIGVLPVGYADGFSRRNSNRGSVLIRGRRAPILGRVCMDMTMVDVTDIPAATAGDEAVIYGRQGSDMISITEVARLLETIPQVLVLTAVSPRVRRVYRSETTDSAG